jgi:penicillin amidase
MLLLALSLLAVMAFAAGWLYLRQSLPQVSGMLTLHGLAAPVEVVRDRYAVPHIYAQSWDDASFALGFVHAQDRLWQMEMNRRIASGRLAEVLGEQALEADKLFRTLGIWRVAGANLEHFDAASRTALEHYAAGINAFLQTRSGPLPPEFLMTGVAPEAWEPVDSVAWGKVMAWDLGGNWRSELLRLRLLQKLTPQQVSEFLPPYPGDAARLLPDLRTRYAGLDQPAQQLAAAFPGAGENAVGSNNWVVSGARSASGKPLLANDPHLGLTTPAIWYFAHLSVAGKNVIGATLPGTPLVVLGRNDHIAWGFTNTGPDVQDLYMEKVDAQGEQYLAPDGYRQFAWREEVLRVKGREPVHIKVRESRHGPIFSDVVAAANAAAPQGHVLAFAWTALQDDDLTAQGAYKLMQAANWAQFVAAVREHHVPQQNMVYADVDGNIGFIAPGRIPVRKRDNELQGMAPAPGWDARYDWDGFIPFAALPGKLNPANGMIVTANQKIVDRDYAYFISGEWAPPYRANRIATLVAQQEHHTVESFRAIQSDVHSDVARDFLPVLLAALPQDNDNAAIRRQMAAWDGAMSMDRSEPLIFAAWMRELTRLVYADELGPELFRATWDQRTVFMHNVLQDVNGASRWCDDVSTPEHETCGDMIRRALPLALADQKQRYGADAAEWRWGKAHAAVSDHRPFGRVPWLGELFGVRVSSPGDNNTVDVGSYTISQNATPYANRHAASLRAIYDLANLDRSVFMHSTGQSGNLLSPFYANFAEPWSKVEAIPMTTRRGEIEAGAIGALKLMTD